MSTRKPSIERPANEVMQDIRTSKWPEQAIKTIPTRSGAIPYAPWQRVAEALDAYTGGHWSTEIVDAHVDANAEGANKAVNKDAGARVVLMLKIYCQDATIVRTAVGYKRHLDVNSAFGSALLSAERNAFKRAAAMYGIADDLNQTV